MAISFGLPCECCQANVPLQAPDDTAAHALIDAWLDGQTLYRCTLCRAMPNGTPKHLAPIEGT